MLALVEFIVSPMADHQRRPLALFEQATRTSPYVGVVAEEGRTIGFRFDPDFGLVAKVI